MLIFVYLITYGGSLITNEGINAQNILLEKAYFCEELPNPKVKLMIVPKNFNVGKQMLDITFLTPIPLGNDIRYSTSLELETNILGVQRWQTLIRFDDDFCRVIQVYLGEFVYELEQALAIPPRSCPIPRGNYHAMNYTPNFKNMKLQTPPGRIQATIRFIEKATKNSLLCFKAISATHSDTSND